MKKFYPLLVFMLMAVCTVVQAQTPICQGEVFSVTPPDASDNCFIDPSNPEMVTEYLIVSNTGVPGTDTLIVGVVDDNGGSYSINPDDYPIGEYNIVPITYDLVILQGLVQDMHPGPQDPTLPDPEGEHICCNVLNALYTFPGNEDLPPGICDSVLIYFPPPDVPENTRDVLQVLGLFTSSLTLRSFQAVIDGINEQAGLLGTFCTSAGFISYCLEPELDQTADWYEIVEPEVVAFDPVAPLCNSDIYDLNVLAAPSITGGDWGGDADPNGEFDGTAFDPGSYDVTYDYIDGNGCAGSDGFSVTVIGPDDRNLDAVATCPVGQIDLTSIADGSWSGESVSGDSFDAETAGPGTYFLTNIYTSNGCQGTTQLEVEVYEPELAFFSDVAECPAGIINLTDLSNPSVGGGTWSGDAEANGDFDAELNGSGFYAATYDYVDANGCAGTADLDFEIYSVETVIYTSPELCPAGIHNLNDVADPIPAGGDWGGVADINGNVDAGALGTGNYTATYAYTDANGCQGLEEIPVQINAVEDIIYNGTLSTLCPFGTYNLNTITEPEFPGTWGGAAAANGEVDADLLGSGDYTTTYDYTDDNGCAGSTTIDIEIVALEVLGFNEPALCSSQGIVDLNLETNVSIPDGTWSGDNVDPDGSFDATAGAGAYTVTYSYIEGNDCDDSQDITVTVTNGTVVSFNTVSLCADGVYDLNLEASPSIAGGDWGAPASLSGNFDAEDLGPGVYEIPYNYADGNCGTGTATLAVTVLSGEALTYTPVEVCPEGIVDLNTAASPSIIDGVWGGAGAGGSFDAGTNGSGVYNATYTYTDGNGCTVTANIEILVFTPQEFDFANTTICSGGVIDLDNVVWPTIGDGSWGGAAAADGTFDAAGLGAGEHQVWYDYTDANGCSGSDTTMLTVLPVEAQAFGPFDICSLGEENLNNSLADTIPAGGLWGHAAQYDGLFDAGAGSGAYNVSYYYIDNGVCRGTEIVEVNVIPVDPMSLAAVTVCASDNVVNLNTLSPPTVPGGEWGDVAETNGDVHVGAIGGGNYIADYYFYDGNTCTGTDSVNVTVLATEEVTYTPVELTEGPGTADLNVLAAPSIPGGIWTGCVQDAGMFNIIGKGFYETGYYYTDSQGCIGLDTVIVAVVDGNGEIQDSTLQVCAALPISFISFKGDFKTNANQLEWTVSSDYQVANFIVERSTDGKKFETIGEVKGESNNTFVNDYAFADEKILSMDYYYRILAVDVVGDVAYSKIIVVKSTKSMPSFEHLLLSPNPTMGTVDITFELTNSGNMAFRLVNIYGQEVAAFNSIVTQGANVLSYDMRNLDNGMYFLVASMNDRQVVRKISKQ